MGSTSGIFVIDIFLSTSSSWVLDTGCGSHICLNVQGLKNRRMLEDGEVDLRVGNGAKVAALAVGTYEVTLPSGLLLVLNNCYYVPALSRNIISISCLDNEGFNFLICDKKFFISKMICIIVLLILFNGLYILDIENVIMLSITLIRNLNPMT